MSCETYKTPNGFTMIVCSRGRRSKVCSAPECDQVAVALCDAPLDGGKTCSAPMCQTHRTTVGSNLDHCPIHTKQEALPFE